MHCNAHLALRTGAFVLLLSMADPRLNAADIPITDIEQGWQQIEARYRSVRLTWTNDWVMPANGSMLTGTRAKPVEMRGRQTIVLALRDDDMRFEISGDNNPMPHEMKSKPQPINRVEGLVSGESRFYFTTGPHPHGEIHESAVDDSLDYSGNRAARFVLRPFMIHRKLLKAGHTIKRWEADSGGKRQTVLEYQGTDGSRRMLWLDPGSQFHVVRGNWTVDDTILDEFHVQYQNDDAQQMNVSGWNIALTMPRQPAPFLTITCSSLTSQEINPEFPVNYFRPAFPPGTWVVDRRTGEHYIQRDNGGRREITPGELIVNARYDRLLNSETGEAELAAASSWRRWLLIGNIALIVIVVLVLIQRKMRIAPAS